MEKISIFVATIAAVATGATLSTFGASGDTFYANDFTTRTSGATPSGRWMEAAYVPGRASSLTGCNLADG